VRLDRLQRAAQQALAAVGPPTPRPPRYSLIRYVRYFRDVDGRDVDFVVIERRKPILMVEAKLTSGPVSPALRYLKERFPACDAYQVHLRGERESVTAEQIHLWTAARFLATLV